MFDSIIFNSLMLKLSNNTYRLKSLRPRVIFEVSQYTVVYKTEESRTIW